MELIDRIQKILKSALPAPQFDIHYDSQNNIVGYIADDFFAGKDDKESQNFIWSLLKKHFGQEELIKVLMIFHETPRERSERLIGFTKNLKHSNFWQHRTPDLDTFWGFIDIFKLHNEYHALYLIINEKSRQKSGTTFKYTEDVISFMEIEGVEIYNELYSNVFENLEAEIKFEIIKKHDHLTEKGLWGNQNMFNYVFEKFELKPVSKNQLFFSKTEIELLNVIMAKIEKCNLKKDLLNAIKNSERLLEARKDFK
jgi:hypothetical protein